MRGSTQIELNCLDVSVRAAFAGFSTSFGLLCLREPECKYKIRTMWLPKRNEYHQFFHTPCIWQMPTSNIMSLIATTSHRYAEYDTSKWTIITKNELHQQKYEGLRLVKKPERTLPMLLRFFSRFGVLLAFLSYQEIRNKITYQETWSKVNMKKKCF